MLPAGSRRNIERHERLLNLYPFAFAGNWKQGMSIIPCFVPLD